MGVISKQTFFETNVLIHEEKFYKYILKKVYDQEVAKDILQNAYVNAWRNLSKLKDYNKIEGWMYIIISNCINEYWRKTLKTSNTISNIVEKQDGIVDLYDTICAEEDVIEEIVKKFESSVALEALDKLNEDDRILIHMRYIDEIPIKQMVKVTGLKVGTLTSRISRALKKYRNIYFELIEEGGGTENEKE